MAAELGGGQVACRVDRRSRGRMTCSDQQRVAAGERDQRRREARGRRGGNLLPPPGSSAARVPPLDTTDALARVDISEVIAPRSTGGSARGKNTRSRIAASSAYSPVVPANIGAGGRRDDNQGGTAAS